MNSALKPVLPTGGPPAGGQASPAKANVAANHSVALPQGAQNHAQNNLAVQNLTHHPPAVPQQPHAPAPSMAPVTANMAQMAQNMSHHGNLSHATQNSNNSAPPANNSAPTPSKPATSAPLSLVQDKVPEKPSTQPLALTRTPEKKEAESTTQSNGTVESPKAAANAPAALKPQNPELMKEKQDIGKASPSTPKPPEKPTNAPNTPQKTEVANAVGQVDGPAYAKVAPANEAPEKSPAKAVEPKPAPTADVAPSQSDSKPAPESAKDPQPQVKPVTPQKPAPSNAESAKPDIAPKVEEKKEEPKPEPPAPSITEAKKEEGKVDAVDGPKKEAPVPPAEKPEEKVEEKKVETPKPTKAETKVAKSTIKLATVNTPVRKRRQTSPNKSDTPAAKKAAVGVETPESSKNKRNRTQVQLYQSPTPELAMATKLSASAGRSTPTKPNDDKLIVFYKNEYLAVRNAEGGFYVCQAMQNVYRSTRKIKIRWLSQDKADPKGVTYKPDFYDVTDMECVLTTLSLTKAGGGAQTLKPAEQARAKSILDRAIAAESSGNKPAPADLTEEHPDGLDLSLYRDESQLDKLDKKTRKRGGDKVSPRGRQSDSAADSAEEATPAKRARTATKRGRPAAKAKPSPKASTKPSPKPSPKPGANATKRKAAGSPPSKTAAVVTEKPATPKTTPAKATKPAKKTPAKAAKAETPTKPKAETPAAKGRRAVREVKPIVPTPSTSTGKTTRTPRKPPSKK